MKSNALFALLLVACGSTPPAPSAPVNAPETAHPVQTAPATPSASAASVEPSSTPAGPPPTAKVLDVTLSKESPLFLHVKISFQNDSNRACRILGYRLTWPDGKKEISLEDFSIPGGENRQRSVRVHPSDGRLPTLLPDRASVEVRSDCAR